MFQCALNGTGRSGSNRHSRYWRSALEVYLAAGRPSFSESISAEAWREVSESRSVSNVWRAVAKAGFLAVLPAVQSHARISFRHLPADRKEEAVQEAIASACVSYQLLAAQGRLHVTRPSTLATYAVHFVRNGRHVGGRQETANDCLSPFAQGRHKFRARGLDEQDGPDWQQVAVANRSASVPDVAAFRIDFAQWLKTLSRRDRRIVAVLAAGEGSSRVAGRFGLSVGRVSQLRRKFERLWRYFQGEGAA